MKILIISYVYPPEVQTTAVMVRELAQDLAMSGHAVTVQTGWPNHPMGRIHEGFRRQRRATSIDGAHSLQRVWHSIQPSSKAIRRLWMYFTFAVSSFCNGLALGRQDVVLSISTPAFGDWAAAGLARLWHARLVKAVFDLWPDGVAHAGLVSRTNPAFRIALRSDTAICRRATAICTLAPSMKTSLVERGIPHESVHVLPFWIDTDRIRPVDSRESWRSEHGIDPEAFVALFAGTIGYASGAIVLAEVAELISPEENVTLLVVGDGVAKKALEDEVRRLGLSTIRFLPFQESADLAALQSAADVGLVTLLPQSGVSSIPSKILTYMAVGLPVVASVPRGCEAEALLSRADCGMVVEPQDGRAIADAVRHLAANRPEASRLGRNGRAYVAAHLSRSRVTSRYESLLVGKRRPT